MIKLNKEDRFYYQKKGTLYFLCLIVLNVLCFEFIFSLYSLYEVFYLGFFVDLFIFLISGPVAFIFVGFKSLSIALPWMLAPLPFLLFVKTEAHFKIFVGIFLVYWISWGGWHFIAYVTS